ncbi:MAG: hypothetical protein JST90_09700 [Bacteroidetes bacterium]|nr:hypothetical protein [Bacteroidota bacterium]
MNYPVQKLFFLACILTVLMTSGQQVNGQIMRADTSPERYQKLISEIDSGDLYTSLHNRYIAYYHLNAPQDTVLKYLRQVLIHSPVQECSALQNPPFPVLSILKDYDSFQLSKLRRFCDSIHRNMDSTVIRAIVAMDENDGKYRANAADAPWIKGNESKWQQQNLLDSTNQRVLSEIMDRTGQYPGAEVVGPELKKVAFQVIIHADLPYQEKYLPMVNEAIKNGQLGKNSYALLVDRINMRKDQPQQFGTQLVWSAQKNRMELYKVQSFTNIDILRKNYNLPPLAKYLQDNDAAIPAGLDSK